MTMLTNLHKTPFPYFGGKADAAQAVWEALGDCSHYVEPFCGSLAVLLRRPHPCNRAYFSETVNDADGFLVNVWRSIQRAPEETANYASWPVSEADITARHWWLVQWAQEKNLERLMGDPNWCDPQAAGYWLYGICGWIGGGWCSGKGLWGVNEDGRLVQRVVRLPNLGNNGKGVNHAGTREPGIGKQLPHLCNNGMGVNRPQAREPGIGKRIPHLTSNGRGVNHPGTREPGIGKQRPHLGDNGTGVNRPQAREPGVGKKRTHISNGGQGVNHPGTREPGIGKQLPRICDNGIGVNRPGTREPGLMDMDSEFHPMIMPELLRWFQFLSARLRHVRIVNGDWTRVLTNGATKMLEVRRGRAVCGIFLDPPYGHAANRAELYACEDFNVADAVREWCLKHGDDPDYRIVLAGFDGEHNSLEDHGWRAVEWFKSGFLKGGMAQIARTHQQHRERLWLSPHCLTPTRTLPRQASFLEAVA